MTDILTCRMIDVHDPHGWTDANGDHICKGRPGASIHFPVEVEVATGTVIGGQVQSTGKARRIMCGCTDALDHAWGHHERRPRASQP